MSLSKVFIGKKVLVTGAGRGLGKALVTRLSEYGAKVYALSKNSENLLTIQKEYPDVQIITANLSNWNETKSALNGIEPLNFLINNAAITEYENFLNIKPESFDSVFSVNLKSVISVSQTIAKGMIANGGGSIVNVSSCASKTPMRGGTCYNASKAALDNLTKTMALELGKHKIRVNSVNPVQFMSDMKHEMDLFLEENLSKNEIRDLKSLYTSRYPLGKSKIEIHHLVNSILFLLSDLCPMISGENLFIDGGLTCS